MTSSNSKSMLIKSHLAPIKSQLGIKGMTTMVSSVSSIWTRRRAWQPSQLINRTRSSRAPSKQGKRYRLLKILMVQRQVIGGLTKGPPLGNLEEILRLE